MDFALQLALIALMLPSSYKVTQHNILSKARMTSLLLDSIKVDLLNKEQKAANALQVHSRAPDRLFWRNKPRTLEEKARFAEWVTLINGNTTESVQGQMEVKMDAMITTIIKGLLCSLCQVILQNTAYGCH